MQPSEPPPRGSRAPETRARGRISDDAADDDEFLRPWIREARGALQALKQGQLEAAVELARLIPNESEDGRAWGRYVDGMLARHVRDDAAGEGAFLKAAALADARTRVLSAVDAQQAKRMLRFAGLCYQRLGVLLVERGEAPRAIRALAAAFEAREAAGSAGERWESAMALRAACERAGQGGEALTWALRAIEIAETVGPNQARCLGESWSALGRALLPLGRYREAASAGMNARGYWADAGSARHLARADAELAEAMLAWAKASAKKEPTPSRARAVEARDRYQQALEAFGQLDAPDAAALESCEKGLAEADDFIAQWQPR